jgi:chromate transporter
MIEDFLVSPFWLMCSHLALLSMMAIGGGVIVVAPEIHRYLVENHHWLTSEQFAASFALGQAAPGPNFLYVTVIGWNVAGFAGAVGATLAVTIPPVLFTMLMLRVSEGKAVGRFGRAMRNGIAPISVGLLLSTGWILARTADTSWITALLTIATIVIMTLTRLNPVWMIAAGAAAGLIGLV